MTTWTVWAALTGILFLGVCLSTLMGIIVTVALAVSLYFNYRHALIILNVTDAVESSLDILDERYASMLQVAQKEVFFDSPEIQQVISDIKQCTSAVLYVANVLSSIDNTSVNDGGAETK